MDMPKDYHFLNVADSSVSPSMVHVKNVALQRFFAEGLLQDAQSVFKFTLPKEWSSDYFLNVLFTRGWISVLDTPQFGKICQECGFEGYDIYREPAYALITNPLFREALRKRIGTECAIIKLRPDWRGVMDIVNYYADMLALCAESAAGNILNAKLAYVFRAGNKASAEAFKKMFDSITSGEPAVFIDKQLANDTDSDAWSEFSTNLSANYIAGDILADMKKWRNDFLTTVGIPNANTDKRERLVTDEVNANNVETRSKCELWLDTMREGIDKANELFGLNLSVEFRNDIMKGSADNGGDD